MNLLEKVELLEVEAAKFGFQWETAEQILAQIQSEQAEISEHLTLKSTNNRQALQEEIGDLLHAAFSLCIFCQFSPEETLKKALEKFERRLNGVKVIAKEQLNLEHLQGQSFEQLMQIWVQAKKMVG